MVGVGLGPDILSHPETIQRREPAPRPSVPAGLIEPLVPNGVRYGSSEGSIAPIKINETSIIPKSDTVMDPVPVNTYNGVLTERQAEIFALNRQGLSNETIAVIFGIPRKSVMAYLAASQKKLRESPNYVNSADLILTPAQTGALMLAAKGKTDSEIAEDVGITRRTVKGFFEQARERLDAITTDEAIIKAIKLNIINPTELVPEGFDLVGFSSRLNKLSPRRREVYDALVGGEGHETYEQIGYNLGMKMQTVKNHVTEMWVFLGIKNRAQAIVINFAKDKLKQSSA